MAGATAAGEAGPQAEADGDAREGHRGPWSHCAAEVAGVAVVGLGASYAASEGLREDVQRVLSKANDVFEAGG